MRFASIVRNFNQPQNRLYALRGKLQNSGAPVTDLISGRYHPEPLGHKPAREAISRYYAKEGHAIPAGHILLTPGTSLSYGYLFKLLANPGEEILCPRPSYPLFESIAELASVRLTFYSLQRTTRWEINLESLRSAISPLTRGIILVSPHNPTGAVASPSELKGLSKLAREHDLPLIIDEVFCPFVFGRPYPRAMSFGAPLVFTLNGFSKMFGLPGSKLGWIALTGDKDPLATALRALEMISDTYLPVNETIQKAVPRLFQTRPAKLRLIRREALRGRSFLQQEVSRLHGVTWGVPEGGFYGVLFLPNDQDDEKAALELLKEGFLVHPGYFYNLEGPCLVINFVQKPAVMQRFLRSLNRILVSPSPGE